MNILGIGIVNHDSSATFYDGNSMHYFKSERRYGEKHKKSSLSEIKQWCEEYNFTPDLVVFTDGQRNTNISNGQRQSADQLGRGVPPVSNDPFWSVETWCIDHHYAHILSTWPLIDTKAVKYGICLDGAGDHGRSGMIIKDPGNLDKASIMKGYDRELSLGHWFQQLGMIMGLKVGHPADYAGKIMGAQSYGTVDYDYIQSIDISNGLLPNRDKKHTSGLNLFNINWRGRSLSPSDSKFFKFDNKDFRDWLATCHKIMEMWVLDIVFGNNITNSDDVITYSGGCAQNVLWNDKLYSKYSNLYIPPHPYDGGLSVGCFEFGKLLKNINIKETPDMQFPYWQDDNEIETPSEDIIKECAKLLSEGKIIGWFQGRGEIGPRALGNRSILLHPGLENGKQILNDRIKHREHWRPFAPSVLVEEADKWFEETENCNYMLRSVLVKPEQAEKIKSVVHQDNTCRVQTVRKELNSNFYKLINAFNNETGIPMLLNTSLNGGGQPIFATRAQCIEFFNNTDIDALCMGNTLLKK